MAIGKIQITKQLIYKLLIILAVSGGLVYLGLIINERRQFNSAERQIDDLYAKIVETVGQPDQEIKDKSCGRSSAKFSKGRLNCSVSWRILYEDVDYLLSNDMVSQITSETGLLKALNYSIPRTEKSQGFIEPAYFDERRLDQKLSHKLPNIPGLSCDVSYYFPVWGGALDFIKPSKTTDENLFIIILCTKQAALIEHYSPND
jgi:hypothetical protein